MATRIDAFTAADGETDAINWMPASPRSEAFGVAWLPRLLDKGRRVVDGERSGLDLMGPYMFGDSDPMDARVLAFLGTDGDRVLDLLRREPDNVAAAREVIRASGRSPDECADFTTSFLRRTRPAVAMIESDEHRRVPGLGITLLRILYGSLQPLFALQYRRAEQRRKYVSDAR